jgi:hypothetical protein
MRISIVSMSCCNPAMRSEDQEYCAMVRATLIMAKVEAQVKIVTISEAASALSAEAVDKLRHLFERHGPGMLPAMLIDDDLLLYGGVPTAEKISEVIEAYGRTHDRAVSGTKAETTLITGVGP